MNIYAAACAAAAHVLRRTGDPEAACEVGTAILERAEAPRLAMDEPHRFRAVSRTLKICAHCSLPKSARAHRMGAAA